MNKYFAVFCVLALALLVSGCVSLPGSDAGKLKVVTIGFDPYLPMIASDDFKAEGVEYAGAMIPLVVNPAALKGFDVVILNGANSCSAGGFELCSCTDPKREKFRSTVIDYVKDGGKVVFVGFPACNSTAGLRRDEFNGILPVTYSGPNKTITYYDNTRLNSSSGQLPYYVPGRLDPADTTSLVFAGVTNLSVTLEGRPFASLAPGANALAYFVSYSGTRSLAVAESGSELKGKAIFFGGVNPAKIDPVDGRSLLLNTLLYLHDAKN